MGYKECVGILESESGVRMERDEIRQFKELVTSNRLQQAIECLAELEFGEGKEGEGEVRFILQREHYIQLVEEKSYEAALQVLRGMRSDQQQRKVQREDVKKYSELLVCRDFDQIQQKLSQWGLSANVRKAGVLLLIQDTRSIRGMLSNDRLNVLVAQALQY